MHELTAAIVRELFDELDLSLPSTVQAGCITAEETLFHEASEALFAFTEFGGLGWLYTAESSAPEIFDGTTEIVPDGTWPRWGELVKENTSLHLRHIGAGWSLTRLETTSEPKGLLLQTHFLAENTLLEYEVYHEHQMIEGMLQLRPSLARFTGFRTKEK